MTVSAIGSPRAEFSAVETFENNEKRAELHYWGSLPIPNPYTTPDIDVHAKLMVTENKALGILKLAGRITGDAFPSTEAFVQDQSGTRVFLGARKAPGGPSDLIGDNKQNLFEVNMQLRFDKKGNFSAVIVDGKTYSVAAWNKKVRDEF